MTQIEDAVFEAMQRLQARALEQVVHASATVDVAAQPAAERPTCPTCQGGLEPRGRQRRTIRPARQRAFIPIAEETGLIVPIGAWVLREACRQAREWQDRFPCEPHRTMSVNLSARQFAHPLLMRDIQMLGSSHTRYLMRDIQDALQRARLDPCRLVLEITESVVTQDAAAAVRILHQLKALGIRVAIATSGPAIPRSPT